MSDFVDWLIPDIPKDISLQIHKEKILMVEVFMKEEQGKRLAAQDHHNQDNCTSPSSIDQSPPQPRSRPGNHAKASVWGFAFLTGKKHGWLLISKDVFKNYFCWKNSDLSYLSMIEFLPYRSDHYSSHLLDVTHFSIFRQLDQKTKTLHGWLFCHKCLYVFNGCI